MFQQTLIATYKMRFIQRLKSNVPCRLDRSCPDNHLQEVYNA